MSNFHTEQLPLVVWVSLNEKSDYDTIEYSPELNLTDFDKRLIEEVIKEFYNSYDAQGEKHVSTSFGEVVIKHEKHPDAERRKLIRGFFTSEPIKAKALPSYSIITMPVTTEDSQIYAFIKEIAPDFVKNDKSAAEYLDKLLEEARLSSIPIDIFQVEVFTSLLDAIKSSANEHISDTS
jgi:hypothetical protein